MKPTHFIATFKNKSYLQSSLMFMLFFASWSIWWSFFQIWLTSDSNGLGLTGGKVGTIYSANSFVTLILMFIYGIIQDKLVIKRSLLIFCSLFSTFVGPFFIWLYAPLIQNVFWLGVALGAIFLSCGFLAAVGAYEAVGERFSRFFNFNYGQARAWGSFGYAVMALVAGFTFVINPHLNFWLGSLLGLILLLTIIFWKSDEEINAKERIEDNEDEAVPSMHRILSLLKVKDLWIIIIFITFSWSFYTIFDQQMFPDFYTKLFSSTSVGQQMYGTLNSVQVFLEAIMMGIVPIIMSKIGVRKTLLLGATVMFLRIGLCGIAQGPISVSFIKMFHALEVPLFILPIFRYITLHFDTKLSATIYMVGYNVSAQVGQVILSGPLGTLRDHIGYQPTFFVISSIVLLAGVFAFVTLRKDDEYVFGDPFIRE
ncbi:MULTISPECIES: MFS transporter [Staphylococcus]|uniref:MFS transporter n=2 Tax=Staphylococcus lugdunensis TaxID=28035 RepID=A0ABX6BT32_STALU|nr:MULTISPECIES: MFS transporter [Staphylococcus]ADC88581.1 Sucrose permease, major facilitator superfamily [Staphylococcus lugdunensis HKU09-01]ARJ07887.1 MFS transporter [Staphylococcus lugdunensis]ARJ14946.1 MFS transporter [Staphylococcus lugdunensis]ARJ17305.1 MFS transporter [Staphylococcus lugdunensis]ARJ28340.1 MFS transporter [Staphylococcus lugdunensis]